MVHLKLHFKKLILFILILGFISLGVIGGCSDNDSDSNGEAQQAVAILLGDHRVNPPDQINAACNISEGFGGELNNIIIDGINFDLLTQEEINVTRDAYQQGFMIIVYDISEAQIQQLYGLVDHPTKYNQEEEFSFLDEQDQGEDFKVFIVEKFDSLNSSSSLLIGGLDAVEFADGSFDPMTGFDEDNESFRIEAFHICELIEQQELRMNQAIEDGLINTSAKEILKRKNLLDEFELQHAVLTQNSTQSGTLTDVASADIHTSYIRLGFLNNATFANDIASADEVNTYTFTNRVWTLTTDALLLGESSWILVDQSMNIDSSNGFFDR